MKRKRIELSARLSKLSWQCHKAISRRMKAEPWSIAVLGWGSLDNNTTIKTMVQSFVGQLLP